MGGFLRIRATAGPLPRARARPLGIAVAAAAIALAALPASALADPSVPPPACPRVVTLQGVERAPGGVILVGRVAAVTPEIGRIRLEVQAWYHRSPVAGLDAGEHPAVVDLALGPGMVSAGAVAPARLPTAGSLYVVAGSWLRSYQGIRVTCGVLASVSSPVGELWLTRIEARYVAVAPTVARDGPAVPLDAPWFILGLGALVLLLAAGFLSAVAEAFDPLPAT